MYKDILATAGPMGSTVEDLVIGMTVLLDDAIELLDPTTAASPWRDQVF